jgi:hypothetical protein
VRRKRDGQDPRTHGIPEDNALNREIPGKPMGFGRAVVALLADGSIAQSFTDIGIERNRRHLWKL